MTDPFVGEIRMFCGNFAPLGWFFCDGSILPISEYETLFQLIGTTYGGDGQETFALPNLSGRVPVHQGTGPGLSSYFMGESGGTETVMLTGAQLPAHSHSIASNTAPGSVSTPSAASVMADMGPASGTIVNAYKPFDGTNQIALSPATLSTAGGNQPHENMQPSLAVSFIISLFGIFPSR